MVCARSLLTFIAVIVLFLVLLALLVYTNRRRPRVHAFLVKYMPFKVSPYSDLQRKRSSLGADLLFTDGSHGDALMTEHRGGAGYGTMVPPVTQPSRAAARPERFDGPPQITTTIVSGRPNSPTNPFDVSPLSPDFPQSPPPVIPARRTSQDSVGGISIASSGVFSPSLLSWPVPPSGSTSTGPSPPPSSHEHLTNLADLQAKYKPLTPTTKPVTPVSPVGSAFPVMPVSPPTPVNRSNWTKPPGWD